MNLKTKTKETILYKILFKNIMKIISNVSLVAAGGLMALSFYTKTSSTIIFSIILLIIISALAEVLYDTETVKLK